jgi:hypothetical protein
LVSGNLRSRSASRSNLKGRPRILLQLTNIIKTAARSIIFVASESIHILCAETPNMTRL